jgi:NADH:ubiquinone oxidoreductase subunit E
MLITERDRLREDVMAVAQLTGFNRASLIPILLEVKEKYRGVDSYAMQLIADVLGIHPVEVYAVATFYAYT